jgi:hypothetical protein
VLRCDADSIAIVVVLRAVLLRRRQITRQEQVHNQHEIYACSRPIKRRLSNCRRIAVHMPLDGTQSILVGQN